MDLAQSGACHCLLPSWLLLLFLDYRQQYAGACWRLPHTWCRSAPLCAVGEIPVLHVLSAAFLLVAGTLLNDSLPSA